jgi:3-hexulose-6-phosphate synthase/6-phospho-3-hexuloisomerase
MPLVVLGTPPAMDGDSFKTAGGDLESSLRLMSDKIHSDKQN